MGSKARIAKHILPIILKDRISGQFYVEPFMGGCNSLCEVSGNRIGGDSNEYLVALFQAVTNGWIPPLTVSKQEYETVRANKQNYDKALVGYYGFCCSYCGIWFGSYAGSVKTKIGTVRNYVDESYRNLLSQSLKLKDVNFYTCSYNELPIPSNSIVYCDPPYRGTSGYKDAFDHSQFWDWAVQMKAKGHTVFVSEYNAPSEFVCVWSQEVKSSLSANGKSGGNKISMEKLFTLA